MYDFHVLSSIFVFKKHHSQVNGVGNETIVNLYFDDSSSSFAYENCEGSTGVNPLGV